MRKILLLFLLSGVGQVFSQTIKPVFYAGLQYGGPLPVKTIPSSTGTPTLRPVFGISTRFELSSVFSFEPGISYHAVSVQYTQNYRRDTLVSISVMGTLQQVLTYYYGNVNGRMTVHYLDLNLPFYLKTSKSRSIMAGGRISYLFAGKDDGSVLIQVGEGGFFNDFNQYYNNFQNINLWESGVSLGFCQQLSEKASTMLLVNRSLVQFYKAHTFDQRGLEDVKMFNTSVSLIFTYSL